MSTIIICEKPNQKKNIQAAIGSSFGVIYAAAGHILKLAEPEDVDPNWARWNTDVLSPPGLRYPFKVNKEKAGFLSPIEKALKTASTVIIATDADREGQMIGQEIIEHLRFKGSVKRVMFSAEDEISIKNAFAKMADNSNYHRLYEAALARANADQIYNLTLTRTASTVMAGAERRTIGIGRVKTATLALVCMRHLAIKNFKPTAFFEVGLDLTDGTNCARLWHKRAHTNLLTDKREADAIAAGALTYSGPISVAKKRAAELPPKPHSLTSLTTAVGKHGIKPKAVLEIAQALYDEHKISTYPRSDVRYLPESMAGDAAPIVTEMLRHKPFDHLAPAGFGTPVIRTGKTGTFSDAGLKGEPHHAIIPNINKISELSNILPKLNPQERIVFDEIARGFLAATGPDHVYDQTDLSVDVTIAGFAKPVRFARIGRVTVKPGWKVLFGQQALADDDEDVVASLPPFVDGSKVDATGTEVAQKSTQPPKPIRMAELPEEMANAWKHVTDVAERDRLKEAKGIGQTSTRTKIIEGLIKQSLIADVKGNAEPSATGLELYMLLQDVAPVLNDPATTARMEFQLDEIVAGTTNYNLVMQSIVGQTTSIRDILVSKGKALPAAKAGGKKPTPPMIAYAESIARRKNIKLPTGLKTDFATCQAFLNQHVNGAAPATPNASQQSPASSASAPRPAYTAKPTPQTLAKTPARLAAAATTPADRVYLWVPENQQKAAFDLKAKWDQSKMKWWVPKTADLAPFRERGWLRQ